MTLVNGAAKDTYEVVKEYYGKVLQSSKDLKTSACTAGSLLYSEAEYFDCFWYAVRGESSKTHGFGLNSGGRPHARIRKLMCSVPKEVLDKFYGCGAPLPLGIEGLRVRYNRS